MLKEVENFMRKVFPEEMERKDEGNCPWGGKKINSETEFRDDLSRKEFGISGLCQSCQDGFF